VNRFWRDQRGAALVVVLLVIVVVMLVGSALLTLAGTEKKISVTHRRDLQALYLAEAGIQKLQAKLQISPLLDPAEWNSSFTPMALGPGKIASVTVTQPEPTIYDVKSVGQVGDRIKKTVKARIKVHSVFYDLLGSYGLQVSTIANNSVLNGDIFFNQEITLKNNLETAGKIQVNGDFRIAQNVTVGSVSSPVKVFVTGNVTLDNNAVIHGDVSYNGNLIRGQGSLIDGIVTHGGVVVEPPQLPALKPEEWYQGHGYTIYPGNKTFSSSSPPDPYSYVKGNVPLANNLVASGTIVSVGDVTTQNNVEFTGYIFCPEGTFITGNDVHMTGVVVSQNYALGTNNTFVYDPSLVVQIPQGLPEAQLEYLSWEEQDPVF